jgi:hypothetical protein
MINILIAKRDRLEHILNCLRFLNYANEKKEFDVNVYVCEDTEDCNSIIAPWKNIDQFSNLNIISVYLKNTGVFNKAKLLNTGIRNFINKPFDWFSVIDCDMLYPPDFFNTIKLSISQGNDYIVCHGWKLKEGTQVQVNNAKLFDSIRNLPKEEFIVGPSQVSISYKCYQIIQEYFPGNLYNEEFTGWGGEDSLLSSVSRKLFLEKKIKKVEINGKWIHQWHEFMGNHPYYEQNNSLFKKLHAEIMNKNLEDKCQKLH